MTYAQPDCGSGELLKQSCAVERCCLAQKLPGTVGGPFQGRPIEGQTVKKVGSKLWTLALPALGPGGLKVDDKAAGLVEAALCKAMTSLSLKVHKAAGEEGVVVEGDISDLLLVCLDIERGRHQHHLLLLPLEIGLLPRTTRR